MNRRVSRSMSPLLRLSPLVSLLTLGACASVLGIEDISSGPAPGAAGDDGTGNTGNSSSGGKSGGGGKTSTPEGGSEPGAGEGPINGAGSGNEAGGTNVPVGGEGNTPDDPTVRGKVIDFWGQAVPNIPVQLGDVLISTDEDGKFEFADVSAEYDVSLAIELDPITSHGYVFQGLTRRDPTLQVYTGLTDRSGNFISQALDVTVGTNQVAMMSIGSPGGAEDYTLYQNGLETSYYWRGAPQVQATAHGLLWQVDGATDLPTAYLGFDSTLVAFDDTSVDKSNIALSLAGDALDSGNLQGTVTPGTSQERSNRIFLRFATGDRIDLVDQSNAPDSFSYLVPTVTGGSITAAAEEGDAYYGEYAVVHQSGLAAGGTVNLKIPLPGSLVGPVDDVSNVDLETSFSFLAAPGSAGTHLIAIHANEFTSCCYDVLWIATTKTQFTIPEVVGGNFLKGSEPYYWRVETHGKYATVDAMTGPTGFLDTFSADEESPQGSRTGSGQYTVTSSRAFTAAP